MGTGIYQNKKKFGHFDGTKHHRLGTPKHPAQLSVQSEERSAELQALCQEKGWSCEITVDPENPEDISDYNHLLNKPTTLVVEQKVGRNDPCTCGSGRKYKKCCGKA